MKHRIKVQLIHPENRQFVPLWYDCGEHLLQALALASFLDKRSNIVSTEVFSYEIPETSYKPQEFVMTPREPWRSLASRVPGRLVFLPEGVDIWDSGTRYCHTVSLPVPDLDENGKLGCLDFYTQPTNSKEAAYNYVESLFQSRLISAYQPLYCASEHVLRGCWRVSGRKVTVNPSYCTHRLVEVVSISND